MSPIFSKKISRFCSFSSRPYFFLSFPIFARKRTGIFYSTHIVKWNNHFCSKIQRVLILLAREIGNTTFHNPTYWFKYQCIQQYFSNYIWERNQIMLKKSMICIFSMPTSYYLNNLEKTGYSFECKYLLHFTILHSGLQI